MRQFAPYISLLINNLYHNRKPSDRQKMFAVRTVLLSATILSALQVSFYLNEDSNFHFGVTGKGA